MRTSTNQDEVKPSAVTLQQQLALFNATEDTSPADLDAEYNSRMEQLDEQIEQRNKELIDERKKAGLGFEAFLIPSSGIDGLPDDQELRTLFEQKIELKASYTMVMFKRDKFGPDGKGIIPKNYTGVTMKEAFSEDYQPKITDETREKLAHQKQQRDEAWKRKLEEWKQRSEIQEENIDQTEGSISGEVRG